jgi:hypothetical protein
VTLKKVQHGCVTVDIPKEMPLPERAGKMSKKEVKRWLKSPQGMESVCRQTADTLERVGAPFLLPQELSAEQIREAGLRSDEIAKVMQDLMVVFVQLSQAKLLFDHNTYDKLRYLKDLVKCYAKHDPELLLLYAPLFELFSRSAKTRKERLRKTRLEAQKVSPALSLVPEALDASGGVAG